MVVRWTMLFYHTVLFSQGIIDPAQVGHVQTKLLHLSSQDLKCLALALLFEWMIELHLVSISNSSHPEMSLEAN